MNTSAWAVGVALLAGTLRAVQLWRANAPVDAVNSVVIAALAEGKGSTVPDILRAGSAVYPRVALQIFDPTSKWQQGSEQEVRARLDRDARSALLGAYRRMQRFAWLDYLALAGILYTGVSALTGPAPSAVIAVELLAATLLWFSNMYGARSLAARLFAGATALVDSLMDARAHLSEPPEPGPRSPRP